MAAFYRYKQRESLTIFKLLRTYDYRPYPNMPSEKRYVLTYRKDTGEKDTWDVSEYTVRRWLERIERF